MQKKLTKHGNSYALVIDRAILDLLKIKPETLLNIATDGKKIIIQPEDSKDEGVSDEFNISLEKVNQRFGNVLKRLA